MYIYHSLTSIQPSRKYMAKYQSITITITFLMTCIVPCLYLFTAAGLCILPPFYSGPFKDI